MCLNSQKYLTKRQLAVIEDLLAGEMSECEVLKKHNVGTVVYRRWLSNRAFADELSFRLESARRESQMMIAKYGRIAAAKLIELTSSKKEETARKACLDVISAVVKQPEPGGGGANEDGADLPEEAQAAGISPEKASKILEILSENERQL
jgi:hypothetical protein